MLVICAPVAPTGGYDPSGDQHQDQTVTESPNGSKPVEPPSYRSPVMVEKTRLTLVLRGLNSVTAPIEMITTTKAYSTRS